MNECRVSQQLFVHLSVHLSYFTFYSELQFGYSIVRLRLMQPFCCIKRERSNLKKDEMAKRTVKISCYQAN